ncbi:MAG: 4Fe-4S binding protein [Candidatus Latescibacteria bacterium]|nr:4Fe-4S binding protein [Candidatus Latescibacterota bacterium]
MSNPGLATYTGLAKKAESILDDRRESGKIRIQVGSATCEHAAGSNAVYEEFRRHIEASGRDDIILRRTGCTGRCSREPIVGVMVPGHLPVKYQLVDHDTAHDIFTSHILGGKPVTEKILDGSADESVQYEIMLCSGERCGRNKHLNLTKLFEKNLPKTALELGQVRLVSANCFGLCPSGGKGSAGHALIRPDNVLYHIENENDIREIIDNHILKGNVVERLRKHTEAISQRFFDMYGDVAFFNKQSRTALRNAGVINPEDIYEYIHYNGFEALARVLEKGDPQWVIEKITASKLRGRGGGGYPTGMKWANARKTTEETRYIICNADEGDPGAFMDRSMLESDPFSIVEGMIIGGYAIGASHGFFYIRAEYPLAIKRIEHAIDECRKLGLLGDNILGTGFSFDLEIRLGAGAFVCGEETALIHSIEGLRGQPRIRPPYPSQSGLWGKPTVINNVETFANVPAVLLYGSEWFRNIGTEKSGGTKVFALAGKVNHTGLVEVPMGTTLREVVFDIGGGVPNGKKLKAVQTGGPAGGCIPEKFLDTEVDFDTLAQVDSIMGSGGMIILDEDDCIVDIARFFIAFSQDESCGKCTPCREGTKRMLEILERITGGTGTPADLVKLERLATLVKKSSLCGLGRAAPNPVLSTLKQFRAEYEAHVFDKKCPAKKCSALIKYEIDPNKCVGCTLCAKNCPVPCISGVRRELHVIDQAKCIKCGRCFEVCRFDAVQRL